MERLLACCLVGLVGCAGAVATPVESAPVPELPPSVAPAFAAPAASQDRSNDWPFLDRAAFAKRLHTLGRDVASKWFTYTTLAAWTDEAASMGVDFYDAPVVSILGSDTAQGWIDGIYGHWDSRPSRTAYGWNLVEVKADFDWALPDAGMSIPHEWDKVFISATDPTIVCIGTKGRWHGWPFPDDYPGLELVVSPGNGRLVVVEMCSARGVLVLPFALDQVDHLPWGSEWPFRRREVFADQLDALGRQLAGASDDEALEVWARAARGLGLRFRTASDVSPTAIDVGHGFAIDGQDASTSGWTVRDMTEAPEQHGSDLFMPAHDPKIAFLTNDGWTLEPPTTGLAHTVLLISPGNGRLVVIEMKRDGLVSILPQAFD